MAGNWIKKAVSKHPGALAKKAKVAGGLTKAGTIKPAFLKKAANSSNPTTAKQANLAKTLKKLH
jgi:hypothetical protein